VHFVGLFLSSLLKMHGPKNKIRQVLLFAATFLAFSLLQNVIEERQPNSRMSDSQLQILKTPCSPQVK